MYTYIQGEKSYGCLRFGAIDQRQSERIKNVRCKVRACTFFSIIKLKVGIETAYRSECELSCRTSICSVTVKQLKKKIVTSRLDNRSLWFRKHSYIYARFNFEKKIAIVIYMWFAPYGLFIETAASNCTLQRIAWKGLHYKEIPKNEQIDCIYKESYTVEVI